MKWIEEKELIIYIKLGVDRIGMVFIMVGKWKLLYFVVGFYFIKIFRERIIFVKCVFYKVFRI